MSRSQECFVIHSGLFSALLSSAVLGHELPWCMKIGVAEDKGRNRSQ